MKALTFSTYGNSDVLEYSDVPNPLLKDGDILVQMKAVGLNYADIMRRSGIYPLRDKAPHINGYEGAGVVIDDNGHNEFKIGDRGYGSDYNETSGTVRIDNFGLTGVYINDHQSGSPPSGGTVHYHIFHKQDSTLAVSGEQLFSGGKEAVPEIKVQLAQGQYFGSFIVCFSEQELLVPTSVPQAANFYVRNSFDNSEAVIYGTLLEELTVERDMQRELIFERLYSEIVFQFVDEAHLGAVRSIQITEVQPVYYTP